MPSRLSQANFIINNPQESKALSKIFVATPTILQEKKIGIIFCLVEMPATDDFNQKIINLIANEAQNNFYTLENLEVNKPLEDLFEDFLYQLNKKIHRLIQGEKTLFDLGKINVIIGIIQPDYSDKKISFNIHFSQAGKIEMILIQKIGYKNYKITQVNKSADPETAKPNPFKFFSNIISGKLANDDYLVLSNYAILDYISLDKLKNAATALPADKLVEHFKSLLVEVDERIPFSFIIFNLKLEKDYFEETLTIGIETMPKAGSEKMTLPEIKKIPRLPEEKKSKPGLVAKLFGRKKPTSQEKITALPQQIEKSQPRYSLWQKIKRFFKKIFKSLKKTKTIAKMERPERDKLVEKWSQQKLKKIDTQIITIKKIPRFSKALLIFGLIFIILFIVSLFFLGQNQKQEKNKNLFKQMVSQIEEKKNLAESSLIYKDETKAKQNIKEAIALLEQLPKNNADQQKEFEKLSAEIKAMDQKLKHLVNILENAPFLDFAKELNGSSINKIIEYNGGLFAWQALGNKIYQIDSANKKISLINYTPLNIGEFKNATTYDASAKAILFLHRDDNKLTKLNLADKTLTPQEIKLPGNAEIADFEIYNNKLYLVDSKNNQIYKYQIIEAGFTNPKNWLTEKNIDLTEAVSIAIDSNLYLLKNNGEILKFYTGKKQNFVIKNLEPALTNPTKIYTSLDDQYIYILEPAQKRLVIADKSGKFIIQYYSEKFSNLKDFTINEKNKGIYLLNDQQLYQITADFIK